MAPKKDKSKKDKPKKDKPKKDKPIPPGGAIGLAPDGSIISGPPEVMREVMRRNKIVDLAVLTHMVGLGGKNASDHALELERGLARLDAIDKALVSFAAKLIEGEPCSVSTDDPETVRRHREMAQHVGASVEVIEQRGGLTRIVSCRPSTQ